MVVRHLAHHGGDQEFAIVAHTVLRGRRGERRFDGRLDGAMRATGGAASAVLLRFAWHACGSSLWRWGVQTRADALTAQAGSLIRW
jgi:hypothetical protein